MSALKILVLDDSEIILNVVSMELGQAGFEVLTANSLLEFDQVLKANEPNIILTDIKMPEVSGDQICRVLKQKTATKNIPVVLFSTLSEAELAALAERSGADGYVCKLSGAEEIVKKIKTLVDEIVF
jgi:CheY-like chemotaxis protein